MLAIFAVIMSTLAIALIGINTLPALFNSGWIGVFIGVGLVVAALLTLVSVTKHLYPAHSKKIIVNINLVLTLTLLASMSLLGGCTKIDPGYVGVKVNLYGGDKGVQPEVVGPGRYFAGPNTTYVEYPSFTTIYTWSQSESEGSLNNESITFTSQDQIPINGDFGIGFSIAPSDAPAVYQRYHTGIDGIRDVQLRNIVRDTLGDIAGSLTLSQILTDKAGFMAKVNKILVARAKSEGITVDSLSSVGQFRLPSSITASMNATFQAAQDA